MSVLLLASIIHSRPMVSPRDDVQQPEVIPFTGVNPTDPRLAHGPDGLRPAAAAIAMIIASEESKGQAPGTILVPYEPNTTLTHLFMPATSTLTSHSAAPSLRTSESIPDVNPAPQSNRSEHDVLTIAIIVSAFLGFLVAFTVGRYIFEYLRRAKRKLRFSQQSWGHKKDSLIAPKVLAPDTDAEEQSLRTFSFPYPPGRKVVRVQDPNKVPSEPSTHNRFSSLIASTAFRQSYPDHDSVTTQDTTSTLPYMSMPYLNKTPFNTQGDHLRSRSTPVFIDDSSMSTVMPSKSIELGWDIARPCRTSQASMDIPSSSVPSRRGSRLSIVETRW